MKGNDVEERQWHRPVHRRGKVERAEEVKLGRQSRASGKKETVRSDEE
jgi:hypothetical protein